MTEPAATPTTWQVAEVVSAEWESKTARSVRLRFPQRLPYLPGQHYDVRLTAPDGYQAQRSYSAASSPLEDEIELTVQQLEHGEVSPYLCQVLQPGDQLEARGPIGGYFVWKGDAPLLLVGGGSGVVPLMSILRHRRRTAPEVPARLLFSVRSAAELLYAEELGEETTVTYTREAPEGWTGSTGRVSGELLTELAFDGGQAFVCGPNGFVEHAADLLLDAGYPAENILTERFGPT